MTAKEVAERCSCRPCRRQVELAAERFAKEKAQPLVAALRQFMLALEAEDEAEFMGLLQQAEVDAEKALGEFR